MFPKVYTTNTESPTLLVVDSTMVRWSHTWKFTLLAWKDWPSTWHIVYTEFKVWKRDKKGWQKGGNSIEVLHTTIGLAGFQRWNLANHHTLHGHRRRRHHSVRYIKTFSLTSLQDNGTVTVYMRKLQYYSREAECTCRCMLDVIKRIAKYMASLLSAICLTFYRLHIARMKYSLNITPQLIPGICMWSSLLYMCSRHAKSCTQCYQARPHDAVSICLVASYVLK